MKIKYLLGLVLSVAVLQLAGCGKKSSDSTPPVVSNPSSTTAITGLVTKGPIAGATVQAFAIVSGAVSTVPLGQATTDNKGNYTIQTFGYSGPIAVEATGGAYNDEISGAQVTLKTPLRAIFSSVGSGGTRTTTIVVSPLTELAAKEAEGHSVLSVDVIDAANRGIASAFSTTVYTVTNIISSVPNKSSSDANQTGYASALTAFSQLVIDSMRVGDIAAGAATMDDALVTVISTLGDELKQTGGFSIDSLGKIELAQSLAQGGGTTAPPSGTPPPPTPPNGVIKFGTVATTANPATPLVGIIMTVTLPQGATVDLPVGSNNAAGLSVLLTGPIALSKTSTLSALVTQGSGTIPGKVDITINDQKSFGIGQNFVEINIKTDTTRPFPVVADFVLSGTLVQTTKLATLDGVNIVPTSLSGF